MHISIIGRIKNFRKKLFADITVVPDALDQSYYPSLNGLRGIAIISVLLGHIGREKSWLTYIDGAVGVHIFFILSGFLITTLLLKEKIKKSHVSLKKFYIRRALRIIPVAYLFLITLIILNCFFSLKITPASFLISFAFLKNIPPHVEWYTAHFWTLSIEEQFYLFFPIFIISSSNRYINLTIFLLVLIPVIDYLGFNNVSVFYTNKIIHTITFVLIALIDKGTAYILTGSLFSILLFKGFLKFNRLCQYRYLSFFLFIAAACIHFFSSVPYLSGCVFAILIGLVLVLNLTEDNFLTLFLRTPLLNWLGTLSYSLYIWQQIFTVYQPWAGRFAYADSIVLNLVLLFITAYCSYNFFEKKFLKLKDRFEPLYNK